MPKFVAIDDFGVGQVVAEADSRSIMAGKIVDLLQSEPGEGTPSCHFSEIRVYELIEIPSSLSISLSE